jgi:hypothetical protein
MHLKGSTRVAVGSITKPMDLCTVTQTLSAIATSAEQLNIIRCKIKRPELRFHFGTSVIQVRTSTALSIPSASTVRNTITSRQTTSNREHYNGPSSPSFTCISSVRFIHLYSLPSICFYSLSAYLVFCPSAFLIFILSLSSSLWRFPIIWLHCSHDVQMYQDPLHSKVNTDMHVHPKCPPLCSANLSHLEVMGTNLSAKLKCEVYKNKKDLCGPWLTKGYKPCSLSPPHKAWTSRVCKQLGIARCHPLTVSQQLTACWWEIWRSSRLYVVSSAKFKA